MPLWSNRRTRQSLAILISAGLIVAALLVAAIITNGARVDNRRQTRDVGAFSVALREAYGQLRGMQTSSRGYLVTRDTTFLDLYVRGQRELPVVWSDLQRLAPVVAPDALTQVNQLSTITDEWRLVIDPELEQRPDARPATAGETEALVQRDKRLFDEFQARYDALITETDARDRALALTLNRLTTISEVTLGLLSLATIFSLVYGISLVRRVGVFANQLQVRQDRQQGYTRVISALNGPVQLKPLIDEALPAIVDSVGAQAGVVYTLVEGTLHPSGLVGLSADLLQPLRLGEGLPGAAVQQNRVLAVIDLPFDTPYRIHSGVGVGPPRSVVNLPLRFGDEILGVLVVASINMLGDAEIQQLQLTASQLATALINARAFDETQRQREELGESNANLARLLERSTTLQEMGRELAAQHELQTLLDLVCQRARRLLRADYSAVATIVDAAGSTKWAAIDGATSEAARTMVFAPHKGTAGRTIDLREPVIIENFGENGAFPVEEFPVHQAEGMKASLSVPLFRKDRAVGALIVAFRRPHTIRAEEIELATALAAYASVAIENARLLGELSAERDLVAHRAIELQEKNHEVERANRLKSEFVANMSHELRTPLNSILALSQILADRLDGELNAEQAKQVSIIERNAHNLLGLINDILDLSKIESGKLELLPAPFNPAMLAQTVRTMMAPLVAEKGIELRVELPPALPRMHSDEGKLKQILLNLLSNAVKFTEHGSVTLSAQSGVADGGDGQPWISFAVTDTGIGIAPQDQVDIWQEFRQIDGSLSRRHEGTGLGLAIVRRLVAMLGGDVALESQPGKGSTFTVSLPVELAEPAREIEPFMPALPMPAGPSTELPRYRATEKPLVLVVDDDPEVIYILEKYLRDDGFEIAVARTGDAAIEQARALRPFAITLDIMLPGTDGWEVIQTLKDDPATADIPIIVVSMLDNRQLGYSLGAAEYLVKPVSRKVLLERLAQLRANAPVQHVLVVEDDLVEQRVLAMVLGEAGLEVTAFASGTEALEWLADHTPDLITLDLMMPGMDGMEVLDQIKHRPHLRGVPVLIITAKEILPEDRVRLNSRIAAIIRKGPSQRETLLAEVRDQLVSRARCVQV